MSTDAKFLDKKTIAELTARMYLDTGAVRFMDDKPFIFTSGWASPVYNDSRWLISFPEVRSTLMDFSVAAIKRDIGRELSLAGTSSVIGAAVMPGNMTRDRLFCS